jgi:hypothetical protein
VSQFESRDSNADPGTWSHRQCGAQIQFNLMSALIERLRCNFDTLKTAKTRHLLPPFFGLSQPSGMIHLKKRRSGLQIRNPDFSPLRFEALTVGELPTLPIDCYFLAFCLAQTSICELQPGPPLGSGPQRPVAPGQQIHLHSPWL